MRRLFAFGCLCILAFPGIAAAEWHLTPLVGLTFAGNTNLIDPDLATGETHTNFGGSVSLLGGGLFGVEGLIVFTPGFFKSDLDLVQSSQSIAMMGNVVLTAPRRWTEYSLRPFVSGGVGLMHVSYEERISALLPGPVSENIAGFNIGGGAVGFFTPRTGVRFDLRYYSNLYGQNSDVVFGTEDTKIHLRYMTFTVGLVLRR
jgi:hypothetical protein